jgi:hypothetical protein
MHDLARAVDIDPRRLLQQATGNFGVDLRVAIAKSGTH